jgi:Undecaprenyl-phosphate glucose phosphotransferase
MSTPLPHVTQGNLTLSGMLKHSVEPILSVVALLIAATIADDSIDERYAILSLIILLITFPGEWVTSTIKRFARQVFTSSLMITFLVLTAGYTTNTLHHFPLRVLVYWLVLMPILVFTAGVALYSFIGSIKILNAGSKKSIVIGVTDLANSFVSKVNADTMSMIQVVGYFDDRDLPRTDLMTQIPVLGTMSDVAAYCRQHNIENVYIALPMVSQPRIIKILDDLRDTTVSIYFIPDLFVFDIIQARVDSMSGIPVVGICESPFLGLNGLIKRVSDIVLSSIILILISPIMLLIALSVKLSSPGPILFKQKRYGIDGSEITVYKFRSMRVHDSGSYIKQATKSDDRITPIGKILRKTSLDELPQFINVLQGCMSVVGPRPHAVSHNEEYRTLIKGYMVRHKVKPGITGWAQVHGYRGETDTLDKMEKRIEYDLDYLRHWSLYLDLWIVYRTLIVVFKDPNAY